MRCINVDLDKYDSLKIRKAVKARWNGKDYGKTEKDIKRKTFQGSYNILSRYTSDKDKVEHLIVVKYINSSAEHIAELKRLLYTLQITKQERKNQV